MLATQTVDCYNMRTFQCWQSSRARKKSSSNHEVWNILFYIVLFFEDPASDLDNPELDGEAGKAVPLRKP